MPFRVRLRTIRAMTATSVPARVSEIENAARALHDPGLTEGAIPGALARIVVRLGLAASARAGEPGVAANDGSVAIDLGTAVRPGTVLVCDNVAEGAEWPIRFLASHAGVAMDTRVGVRAARRREEALRAISEELQDALLPSLPALAHTSMHVLYRAASTHARVGGDFYDVFGLPDGRVLVVVGDVMGKGVHAASHTARITHTLRALALQNLGLDTLLERCDEQIRYQNPDTMATIWCGFYTPTSGELQFASLGHPPALLVRADAEPISLSLEGLPLGMRDLSDEVPEVRTRRLEMRDLLVLYTDGLVESSGDYVAGQRQLRVAVEARKDEPLAELVESTLHEMLDSNAVRDDVLMLVLRRR